MTTLARKKKETLQVTTSINETLQSVDEVIEAILNGECERKNIPLDLIDIDPKNRRHFKPGVLEELAADIKVVGVIQDILVTPTPDGRYRLVAGEGRVLASRMNNLPEIPAKIKDLSEAQIRHIRFSENANREDLSPMDQALQIQDMLEDYNTPPEVAKRLGKPVQFIYDRLKLVTLIPENRNVLQAENLTIGDAIEIATLSDEAQKDFYDKHLSTWEQNKGIKFPGIKEALKNYKCNLNFASFALDDQTLVPEMKGCNTCPFNSSNNSLFPNETTDKICSKRDCFEAKTKAQFIINATAAAERYKPKGLVLRNLNLAQIQILKEVPGLHVITHYDYNEVFEVSNPQTPSAKSFTDHNGKLNQAAYNQKLREHKESKNYFHTMISKGKIIEGLIIHSDGQIKPFVFSFDKSINDEGQSNRVAEIQAAIKGGYVTTKQIEDEIQRLTGQENRIKENNAEIVQKQIHQTVTEQTMNAKHRFTFTEAVKVTSRWLLYNMLNYDGRKIASKRCFPGLKENATKESFFKALANMNNEQYSILVRLAILTLSSGSSPLSDSGFFIKRIAEESGINVAKMNQEQIKATSERTKVVKEKIQEFQSLLKRKKQIVKTPN
jgi:ParB/RepB/Spo0J family partition protein